MTTTVAAPSGPAITITGMQTVPTLPVVTTPATSIPTPTTFTPAKTVSTYASTLAQQPTSLPKNAYSAISRQVKKLF